MTEDELERLAAVGLYDPAAVDAEDQRRLLERLVADGFRVDELEATRGLGPIVLRAFEHIVLPGERMTLDDVAAATGLTPEQVLTIRRGWGLPDPAPDAAGFTPAEAMGLQYVRNLAGFVGPDLAMHIARVMGTAMSRLAEAEIALVRSRMEAPMVERGESRASMLQGYANLFAVFLPATLATLDFLHRAHLLAIGRRYREVLPPSEQNVIDTIVGFADLTASTRLVQETDLDRLDRALAEFERITTDLLAAAEAPVVKRLGDGVMFVAADAAAACRVALDLVDAFRDHADVPPVRVGLAAGRVAALRGDFFGPAVHLAARIVAAAAPSTALVADAVRARVEGAHDVAFVAAGVHALAGFTEPIVLHRATRAAPASVA